MKTKIGNKIILVFSIFFMLSTSVLAQSVTIDDVNTAVQGSPASTSIDLVDLGLVGSVSLTINYDPTVLTFNSVTPDPAFQTVFQFNNPSPGVITMLWLNISVSPNITGAVDFATIEFDYIDCISPVSFDEANCEVGDDLGTLIPGITYVGGSIAPADNGPAVATWTGATDNDWDNPANWLNNEAPGCGSDIIIQDAGMNYPVIPATKASVKVNSMTIQPLGALTVLGSLELLGDLIMEPDASIIENGNVTVAGITNFQIAAIANEYRLISPPVDYVQAVTFFGHFLRTWDEPTQVWENINAPSDILDNGVGYSLNAVSNEVFFLDQGALNSGDNTISGLTYTTGLNPLVEGFHLVGNHFPSAVDFFGTGWALTNVDPTAWVWDEGFGNYRVSGVSFLTPGVIPPAQGFFVRAAAAGGGELTVPQAARVHGMQPMYKESTDNKLSLLVEGNNYGDMIAITLNDDATVGYDLGLDAYKLTGYEEAPQMYSVIEDDIRLSGNTLPYAPSIAFNLEVGADGEYTITADGMGTFAANATIELEDMLTGDITNLKETSTYTFQASTTDDPERFMLHFGTLGIEDELYAQIKVYGYNSAIHVNFPVSLDGQVYIYNTMGQEIVTSDASGNNTFNVDGGVNYIVKVVTENGVKTEKVFVK